MFAKVMVGGLALGAVACATSGSQVEVRGRTALQGTEAKVVIVGPMRLLHLDSDRSGVMVYRVPRHLGTEADCQAAKNEMLVSWDRESNLQVGKDEMVCVSGTRRTQVSWHARPVADLDLVATQQSSLR